MLWLLEETTRFQERLWQGLLHLLLCSCQACQACQRVLGVPGIPQGFGEDDYILFDCPGQIELYSHVSVFRSLVDWLRREAWATAAVYCVDCQFAGDPTKFIAGSLQARPPPALSAAMPPAQGRCAN